MGISCNFMMKNLPSNILLVYEIEIGTMKYSFITNRYVRNDYSTNNIAIITIGTTAVISCSVLTIISLITTHKRIRTMKKNKKAL